MLEEVLPEVYECLATAMLEGQDIAPARAELTALLAERDSLTNQRDQAREEVLKWEGMFLAAEARAEAAEQALLAAIETFDDLRLGLELLRHPVLAMACQVAIDGSRAALAAARPEQESE